MFGYVKPFIPELKICEYDAYKSVYCGLCGQLGKSFGPIARLSLSYDFTFLSMLYFAVSGEEAHISTRRCYVNPLRKTPCLDESEALRFGADIAAIMLYYKLLDNISDGGFFGKIGWSLLRPLASSAYKKAAAARPEAESIIRESVERQAGIEARDCSSLDEAADPTADAMSKLCGLIPADDRTRRVLTRFGYFLGRYSYLCDALDDLESDLRHGGYNPLIPRFSLNGLDKPSLLEAKRFARESINMTVGEAALAYDLLDLHAFKPVLDNIVSLGMLSLSFCEKGKKSNTPQQAAEE